MKENPVELSNKTDGQKAKMRLLRLWRSGRRTRQLLRKTKTISKSKPHLPILVGVLQKIQDPASSPPTLRSRAVIQDSTDDEDDLDAPSQRSVVPDSVPLSPPRQQPKKLGAIGRSKPPPAPAPKVPNKSKSPVPQAKANGKHPVIDDEETASEDEDDPPTSKIPHTPQTRLPSTLQSQKRRPRQNRRQGQEKPHHPSQEQQNRGKTTPDHKPKHKLGVIGHKAPTPAPEADEAKPYDAEEARGRGRRRTEEREGGAKRDFLRRGRIGRGRS